MPPGPYGPAFRAASRRMPHGLQGRLTGCKTGEMSDVATELMLLAGGDPFERVRKDSEAHQRNHSCHLHTAGPEVMQLAASYVRAGNATDVLDLGCGLGYSTLWLAAGANGRVIGVDSDEGHVSGARRWADVLGFEDKVRFVAGHAAAVLDELSGPFDAIHDDAWFASAPDHVEVMISLLRPGGVLTMPNWFLLVDAITGQPRNDWERFGGPTWAADTKEYARQLVSRPDLSMNWIVEPPLGVAVKS